MSKKSETNDSVRGCTLSWYGFTDGGNLADIILRGKNPIKNLKKLRSNLKKLQTLLEMDNA